MSEALDYLLAVRPGPMQAYFEFLKQAPGCLDPKTRALISVITKVGAQTERGFRQYLKRALRAGASPDEVLDALLMAFPLLGLTKLVWAVDQLLCMDLPEFGIEALKAARDRAQGWVKVGTVADFPAGRLHQVELGASGVFIHFDGASYAAFRARCPHQAMPLSMADFEPDEACITCPRHGWRFRMQDGGNLTPGLPGLEPIPVQCVDTEVQLRLAL